MRRSQRGFTLVELMVVVAIIAILSALLVSVSGRTYGQSSNTVSDQIMSEMNLAKMRAVSTRSIHWVNVTKDGITMWAATTTGFSANPSALTYELVERVRIPEGVVIWDTSTTACAASPCSGAPTAANASLDADFYFKPDGSSSGGTVFVTDNQGVKKHRVVVYSITGSSYARENW